LAEDLAIVAVVDLPLGLAVPEADRRVDSIFLRATRVAAFVLDLR